MVDLKAKPAQDRHGRDRNIMVAQHLATRGICDPLVLAAMGSVPREAFVPETVAAFAYEDSALPLEAGQTISQPYIVARMIELLELTPTDKVLEVGAGSGYAAAVLSRIAGKLYAIERYEMLADLARATQATRLNKHRDHSRRRHHGMARAGAIRCYSRFGRRAESARSPKAAAHHRRSHGHPGRPRHSSDIAAGPPRRG
jgi:protein-L-isoaspartate(D-aspartate) O-methyltransferase